MGASHPFAGQNPQQERQGRFYFYVPQVSFVHGTALPVQICIYTQKYVRPFRYIYAKIRSYLVRTPHPGVILRAV